MKINLQNLKINLKALIWELLGIQTHWTIQSAYTQLNLKSPFVHYQLKYRKNSDFIGSIALTTNDLDRQTGKTILTIISALIASQYSKVVIVCYNYEYARFTKKAYHEYSRKLNIPINNLFAVVSFKDFVENRTILSSDFIIPFVDPMCYTKPKKICPEPIAKNPTIFSEG